MQGGLVWLRHRQGILQQTHLESLDVVPLSLNQIFGPFLVEEQNPLCQPVF